MIIKSLRLENIRSYTNQLVSFPNGSVLLSGDIGSGKSTVLLAMEFALFGISRGSLSGSDLLRHGNEEGSVELKFNVDNQDYTIKRNLKKSRDIIAQSSGYILKGDEKKDGTPQELKTEILNILGYPQEILTKKSMIFRYTVYTPQEEMKSILFEDKDMRLDTLRKVFDIDKYKKIIENSVIVTRKIKEDRKLLQGKIFDLNEKNVQFREESEEKQRIDNDLLEVLPRVTAAKGKVSERKISLREKEAKINELNEHKRKLEAVNARVHEKVQQNSKNSSEMEQVGRDIEEAKKKIEISSSESIDSDSINRELDEMKQKLIALDEEVKEKPILKEKSESGEKQREDLMKQLEEKNTLKKQYEISKIRINQINECPTCKQTVSPAHKQNISGIEDAKIRRIDEELLSLEEKKNQITQEMDNSKIKVVMIENKEKEMNELKQNIMQIQHKIEIKQKEKENLNNILNEKNNLLESKLKLKQEIKDEVSTISQLRETILSKLEEFKGIDEEYKKVKDDLDLLLSKEREVEIKEAELRKEMQSKERRMVELKEEIDRKLKAKEKIQKLNSLQEWIESYFTKLMATMEKHVMAKVHVQFNELFQKWFGMLMEDEMISARLDENFSPIMVQNGYETDISNLSGGEKTSVALAYRLSLNKVINDVISTIKTKELIILDEPTDGFSTEQLDKVRDVLEELDTKQTIIVSHESKIESYVDNVIRIAKGEHVSKVIS